MALRGIFTGLLSLVLVTTLWMPSAGAAAKRPNLVIGALAPSASQVVGGGQIGVTVVVSNRGKARAAKSTSTLVLSADATMGAGDQTLGSLPIPALKPRKSTTKTTSVSLPAAPGNYYLIACADTGRKVRESKEGDNCSVVPVVIAPRPTPPSPTARPKVVSVSATPNPLHIINRSPDPVTGTYEVVVKNDNTAASAATSVSLGIPSDGGTVLNDSKVAVESIRVPELPPGGSVTLSAPVEYPTCDNECEESTQNLNVVACIDTAGALSGCLSTPFAVIVDPCGCWPDDVSLTTSVAFDDSGLVSLGEDGAELPVTIHFTNEGQTATQAVTASLSGFVGSRDPDFGWMPVSGVTQPDPIQVRVPALGAGEDVDIAQSIHLPAYVGTTRASTSVFALLRRPGKSSVLASDDRPARVMPTYDGTNEPDFLVQPGSVTAPRFFGGVGKSDSERVKFTWSNTGTDPGDVIGVAAQINDTPQWDPDAPTQGELTENAGLSGSVSGNIDLTWNGPVPSGQAYVVVCADAVASGSPDYWPHVEADETNNCVSTPAKFVDLDSGPSPVPGYEGQLPAANPMGVTVSPAGSGVGATFGWERLLPYNQVNYDDQVWTLDPASGVHATVTMPWTTFIENIEFTAKPVTISTAADPLPFDNVIAAVDLEPGDLLTNTPFTVDFALDPGALAGINQSELVAFAADSDGSDLRLLPLTRNADGSWAVDSVRVTLSHFGVVGLATISSTARAALASRVPADNDQQIEAESAQVTLTTRLAALGMARLSAPAPQLPRRSLRTASEAETEPDLHGEEVTAIVKRYNNVLVPAFDAAYIGGELEIEVSLQMALEWQRAVQLIGFNDDEVVGPIYEEVGRRFNDLLLRHADLVKQRCTNGGGFYAFRLILKELRSLELWGLDAKAQELKDAMGACSSFQATYHQTWADQNTNAALSGSITSAVTMQAPTTQEMRTGMVPHGNAPLQWDSYTATTTDNFDTYDDEGNLTGHCQVTTTDSPTSNSYMTLYVRDYGLSFLRGGGHRRLAVSVWLFGSSTDPNIGYDVPLGIHRSRVNGCPDGQGPPSNEWDVTDKPYPGDPALHVRDGFRDLYLDWEDGVYTHTWSVSRGSGLHPTEESLEITVAPDPF